MIRLKGPRHSFHNPIDGLRVQPLNYVHNWTSPTTIKRKKTTPKACPVILIMNMMQNAERSLEQRWKKKVVAAFRLVVAANYAVNCQKAFPETNWSEINPWKNWTAASCSTLTRPTGWNRKMASSSLYLDELLIQKCKFRHRFTVNC